MRSPRSSPRTRPFVIFRSALFTVSIIIFIIIVACLATMASFASTASAASSEASASMRPTSLYNLREANEIVRLHNEMRREVEPGPAANMQEVAWSTPLATSAQGWAEECVWHVGQKKWITELRVAGKNLTIYDVGQNMFKGTTKAFAWRNALASWHAERNDYDYFNKACRPGKVCGHYTQVVWSDSIFVGCGWATCASEDYIVCNYYPGGNWKGERPYELATNSP